MTTDRSGDYLVNLVRELCKLPGETEWVEFKVNNSDPQEIGKFRSAEEQELLPLLGGAHPGRARSGCLMNRPSCDCQNGVYGYNHLF